MTPVETSSLLQLGQQHGPLFLLAAALAFACWRLVERTIDRADKQLEQREKTQSEERKTDREAYLAALGALTAELKAHNAHHDRLAEDLREIRRSVTGGGRVFTRGEPK